MVCVPSVETIASANAAALICFAAIPNLWFLVKAWGLGLIIFPFLVAKGISFPKKVGLLSSKPSSLVLIVVPLTFFTFVFGVPLAILATRPALPTILAAVIPGTPNWTTASVTLPTTPAGSIPPLSLNSFAKLVTDLPKLVPRVKSGNKDTVSAKPCTIPIAPETTPSPASVKKPSYFGSLYVPAAWPSLLVITPDFLLETLSSASSWVKLSLKK